MNKTEALSNMSFNYRSYNSMISLINKVLPDIICDIVVGIPRSGVLPASIIATKLNKPFATFNDLIHNHAPYVGGRTLKDFHGWEKSKVLIVDDSLNNGNQLKKVQALISKLNITPIYLAVYVTPGKESFVDISLESLSTPRLFEWNILNHSFASRMCYDLDGVLCADPTNQDVLNENTYTNFLQTAKPLYIPSHEIGSIVTSRLSIHREQTEKWLKCHGIKYRKLVMMNTLTAQERRSFLAHSLFKAHEYKESGADLFIESCKYQAIFIARTTGMPCFCVENNEVYDLTNAYSSEASDIVRHKKIPMNGSISSKKRSLGSYARLIIPPKLKRILASLYSRK